MKPVDFGRLLPILHLEKSYFVVGGARVRNVLICILTEEIISNSRNLLSENLHNIIIKTKFKIVEWVIHDNN